MSFENPQPGDHAPIIRVARPFAYFAKGWGMARGAAALAMLALSTAVYAQVAPCGLSSMNDTTPLQYPPIARAVHMTGDVIFIVKFGSSGSVDDVAVLSGPEMLREAATRYVKGLQANAQSGTRECPFVVGFKLVQTPPCENTVEPAIPVQKVDIQHVVVQTNEMWLCDPPADTRKRKHFLFF